MGSKCKACGATSFPPRADCGVRINDDFEVFEIIGNARLHTYSKIMAAPTDFEEVTPYIVGVVDLEEGGKLLAWMGDTIAEKGIEIGMELQMIPQIFYKKSTIYRVNGICIAGGQEVGMACDLAFSSDLIMFGKTGCTREGALAIYSHSGSLMDQDTMAYAMFEKAGVLRFYIQDDMCKATIVFAHQSAPTGNKGAIVTHTGGPGIQALYEPILGGLELADLKEETMNHLRENLHPEATVKNPMDFVATATPDHYGLTVQTLFKDPNCNMVLVKFITAPFVDLEGIAQRLKEAGKTAGKHVVCTVKTIEKCHSLMQGIRDNVTPVYDFTEDWGKVLLAMAKYGELRARKANAPPHLEVDKNRAASIIKPYEDKDIYLPHAEVFEILNCYGIGCCKTLAVKKVGDLMAAADVVGFPCMLKVDSNSVVYKSDESGEALNLVDNAALEVAFKGIQAKFKDATSVVQAQKADGRELMLGTKAQEGLDPLVMFGLGGIFVEAMKDMVFWFAPLSKREAESMIHSIKGLPIIEGIRGMQPVDMACLADMLIRFFRLAADFTAIEEIDLNPVFATDERVYPKALDTPLRAVIEKDLKTILCKKDWFCEKVFNALNAGFE